jgi:dihydroorotate dehydrogenase (fumarate)
MANLETTYMGIKLKSPLILGSCNLAMSRGIPEKLEEAGIGAIVYKSLFEEQIQLEGLQMSEDLAEYEYRSAESEHLFPGMKHAGPSEHLFNISKLKKNLSIPVIASLNAIYDSTWIEYAKELEKTGVDALELNLYSVPTYFEESGQMLEDKQVQIVDSVKQAVKIPVSVKVSPYYTNPLNFIKKIDEAGADAYILFNRFFHPDIDINREKFHFPWSLSYRRDYLQALRFTGVLYGNLDGSICASGGIYQARDVIKLILAGADAVQVVSVVYKNKPEAISDILMDLSRWMDEQEYASLNDFKGKLSRKNLEDPFVYQRAQYVDILMKSEEVFKKYPMI